MLSLNFEPRAYQEKIARIALSGNTLVVLPTGLGKTNVFVMVALERLKERPDAKILLLGPTRPLIDQYLAVFTKQTSVPEEKLTVLTGKINPENRAQRFADAQIIFSTPQGLENDLITKRISLENVALLGIDEAHRAVGEYSYVWIADQYLKYAHRPRIIALTASPGADKQKIQEVVNNLQIEHIESRTHDDPDVKRYIQPVKVIHEYVSLPDNLGEIAGHLRTCFRNKIKSMSQYLGEPIPEDLNRKDLLSYQAKLQGSVLKGSTDFRIRRALSLAAEAMKVQHAVELAESQGLYALKEYCQDIFKKAQTTQTKATKNLAEDSEFRNAYAKTLTLIERDISHPKMDRLKELVTTMITIDPDAKAIIFNNYRDNAGHIVDMLNTIDNVRATLFVGQSKKKGSGLSQKDQKTMIQAFASGEYNFLVSTSIGEEGLDIPKVDAVIFYEPVPSAIRAIQRRGRTGRSDEGKVIVLVTKGTRDEAYLWSTRHKERTMHRNLRELSTHAPESVRINSTLKDFEEEITVIADARENGMLKALTDLGRTVDIRSLESADYQVSDEVGIEFKTAEDFAQSLIDGRLLAQARAQRKAYARPIMIIEGFERIYTSRNLHANAIRGALCALALDFQITLLPTKNPKESAALIAMMARREQSHSGRPIARHAEKDAETIERAQEYVASALPGIGPTLAPSLLEAFKTLKSLANASPEDIARIEKIGKKKSERIWQVFNEHYR